jgi:hypothetical protein
MKHPFISLPERPAFMKIVDCVQQEINNGYILRIDEENHSANIIILKKGGSESMFKTEVKALEGFENIFNELQTKKANLEEEKAAAIAVAVAEVEEKFKENSERIDKAIETISETIEIEIPDQSEACEPCETEACETPVEKEKLY